MKPAHLISDEELVEIVRTDDRELFTELIKRYEKKLVRYATYLINDPDRAADAVQEAFIKAFINLHVFDIKKKFSSWIYRIVHNEVMNALKKRRFETPLLESMDFPSCNNIEDDISKEDIILMVRSCIGKMSPLYAEPLSLYFLEEKTYEEISNILRIPMGTVATRINRAKKIIKKLCQANQKI